MSFALIGLAVHKYYKRTQELERGVSEQSKSDFLDIYSPIVIAGALTVGVVVAITIAIHDWEVSRYS